MAKKVFIVDAYDSFVYMLYQYFGAMGLEVRIVRKDKYTVEEIKQFDPDYIVLSPGPGHPKDSNFLPVLENFLEVPTLGVCLGHQAIGLAFGGEISIAPNIMHGKTSTITHDGRTIFEDVKNPFEATRYHSLVISKVPPSLSVSAKSMSDELVMAVRHIRFPLEGVQFHPESVMTKEGKKILRNFVDHYG
ncbi:MAG: aminodeoxychorismate/anthranilate synthase component II [Candidatus Micrarchaeia archaeon]